MAKEITLELLTDAVARQGLVAARALVDAACADVDAGIERARAAIAGAQAQMDDLGRRRGMYHTLLIGAVKKASMDAGVELALPAAKLTRQTRPSGRSNRGYSETAEQFVLNLLKAGAATSGEIIQAWAAAGRGSAPDSALTPLQKAGKVKREKLPGRSGSRYSLA